MTALRLVSPVTTASGKLYGTTGVGDGETVGDGDAGLMLGATDALGRGVAEVQEARMATTIEALARRSGIRMITTVS
jgi:hypothetical protein